MPGLSVARGDPVDADAVGRALDATSAFEHYVTETRFESDGVSIGTTTYDGYPIASVDTVYGTVILEGCLYDVDDVEAHMERVAAMIAADDRDALAEWVGARDGDFLLAVADGETVALCNDALGRLPAYLTTVDGTTVCSRELAFVRAFARDRGAPLELDRLAIGQLLAFGYPLGTRTPFADVQTVPPGSLVRLRDPSSGNEGEDDGTDGENDGTDGEAGGVHGEDGGNDAVTIDSLYDLDVGDCTHADRSLDDNADELADRIAAACRRRSAPDRRTVVSLSGGLDSRTVAAAYAGQATTDATATDSTTDATATDSTTDATTTATQATTDGDCSRRAAPHEPPIAATFQRDGGRNDDEVAAAGTVATLLDLDWSVHTARSSPERRETLLRTKLGTNYLGIAFVLDFLEQLRERYGTTTYVTGDGGDKLLVGLEPAATPDSRRALVEHAIEANSRLPLADAAAIANVDPDAIRASVARRFAVYPESDLARRYVHFLLRERGINFLVQGEDRNRYYAWTVAPFYALPVYEYAMNCPDDQKAYRRLQSAILERFDPGLVDLPYPNYGAPVSTRRYRVKQFVYDALERFPAVRDRVVDLVTDDGADTGAVADAIRSDLPRLDAAGLSSAHATDVLETSGAHSTVELELLATVAALAGEVVDDRRVGEDDRTADPSAGTATVPGSDSPADREANDTASPTDDASSADAPGNRTDASTTPSGTPVDR